MYGQGDSIDVSQLHTFALGMTRDQFKDRDLLPEPDTATPSRVRHEEITRLNEIVSTKDSAFERSRLRSSVRSELWPGSLPQSRLSTTNDQRPQRHASQPDLPSTIPDSLRRRMLKNDSQSEGDTQPLSQSLYEQYNSRSKEQRAAQTTRLTPVSLSAQEHTPHILQRGEPGHVDLIAAFEQPSASGDRGLAADDADDDDIDPLSQDIRADIFPESRRFQPPKTPASQGRKRKRGLETSSQGQPTPSLPTNPFAGQMVSMDGIMGASQLFQATQAVTSPLTNIIASDGLSERPSPDMHNFGRPSTAGSLSSPVRLPKSNMMRAVTEPQAVYVSMKESQEARERLLRARKAEQVLSPDEMSDDDFDDDPQLRRRLRQQRYNLEAKDQFARVAARSESAARGNGRGGGGPATNTLGTSSPRRPGKQAGEPVLISDDAPAEDGPGSISEAETEREDEMEIDEGRDDIDELAEDNKENVEVPGTVSRGPVGRSQVTSSQPTPSHKRIVRPKVSSPSKRAVQVLGSSQVSNLRDTSIVIDAGTQPDAIADSQSSQNFSYMKMHNVRPGRRAFSEPRSALDSRILVPQSQSSEGSKILHLPRTVSGKWIPSQNLPSSPSQNPRASGDSRQRIDDHHVRVTISSTDTTAEPPRVEMSNEGAPRLEGMLEPHNRDAQFVEPSSSDGLAHKGTIPDSDSLEKPANPEIPVPDSSTFIPSPRTTPKSAPKVTSTHSISNSSRVSTMFETAPERRANSISNLSPVHRLRRSQSTHSSPEKSRRLRSMSEIAAEPSPPDVIGEVNIDIDILSNEDREFQNAIDRSSQTAPSSKRLRGCSGLALHSGLALPNADPAQSFARPLPGSPLPPPSSAVSKITPIKVSSIQQTPAPSSSSSPSHYLSPVAAKCKRQAENQNVSTSEPQHKAIQEQAAVTKSPSRPKALSINANVNAAKEPAPEVRSNEPGEPSTAETDRRAMVADRPTIGESPVVAPNRVFAHFNGSSPAYHPATCLEFINGEEPRYRVRFDDGTVDTISAYGIKRLELRIGDVIKVDLPGARTKSYVVEGMRDHQRPAIPPDPDTPSRRGRQHSTNDAAFPEIDLYGFATVLVSPKQRVSVDGNPTETSQVAIPLSQIYFTQTLWTSFKNRQYTHVSTRLQQFTGLQTPSERPSTPSTPSSRARRVRTSGVAQSRTAITRTHTSGEMFKNMAFAITNIDRAEDSKRVKDQILSHGGTVLDKGFDELFNVPALHRTTVPNPNSEASFHLTPEAQDVGFTCLIADKHCRRAKFIQALVLGIPCLATRWVSDCVAKQHVLPWAPYLLPSGESAFLGGAIRSRNLQPFPADDANLIDIVNNRSKLLDGASILLIMEKSQEETMKQHPLITHALGASKVARAINVDVAAKAVADAEALNDPWDWVFSYDKEKEVEKRLLGGGNVGKKRKRGRDSNISNVPVKKTKTKVVGNEFVIQSLILGMLIDER